MLIYGVEPFTMLDFPEHTAAIVFTAGCNLRCGYCHNAQMLSFDIRKMIDERAWWNFLAARQGRLDGVVISGGEPTLQKDLPDFIRKIKSWNFLVKLDTNGTRPEKLKSLLEDKMIDFVAMDLKTIPESYGDLTGRALGRSVLVSLDILKKNMVAFEVRLTYLPELHSEQVLERLAKIVEGVERFSVQAFRPAKVLKNSFASFRSPTESELIHAAGIFQSFGVKRVEIKK